MNDRELLELAAAAAGLPVVFDQHKPMLKIGGEEPGIWRNWNPLTDDGDALRLAAKLKLNVHNSAHSPSGIEFIYAQTRGHPPQQEYDLADPYAATCRAIVLSAAEVGKAMP